MNWIAPRIDRIEVPPVGDERALLEAWLDHHRQTLLLKCAGLTADRLKLRAVEPSSMSLLGLVRHMAEVERSWFRRRFTGEPVGFLYRDPETNPDGDFDDVDTADAEADFATFAREIELARAATAGHSLEETFHHSRRNTDMSLRWVYLHMIEEYARHNGHADLLRERIDGVTGA
ncbi:DinB family protein [Sphaerimonospora sp. CA-214678]|uniref:DinB family protein n=1 Tax=Sphaerimonospora sp. CA-214678 TaxID=3240029 RepID=UPI003D8AC2B3